MRAAPEVNQAQQKQIERIRRNWLRMRRLGMARFIGLYGSGLLLVMCVTFTALMYLHRTPQLLHASFVLESSLPCMVVVAYAMAAMYFWSVKASVRRLLPEEA